MESVRETTEWVARVAFVHWPLQHNQRKALAMTKKTVELNINGEHTAAQVDELLSTLALIRADMEPPVPMTRSELAQETGSILVEDKPSLLMAALRGGGFRLWLRHRGFGWLAYQIDNSTAVGMRQLIQQHTAADAFNLVEHEDTNRH